MNISRRRIAEDKKGPLFRAAIDRTGKAVRAVQGNHSFRAIGTPDYLDRGGDINIAKRMAGHSNVRTRELYDRCGDEESFSGIER
jgi:hypothetical protein